MNLARQCIVVAVDSRKVGDKNIVHTHGGSKPTDLETETWIQKAVELGAGEILLTSMDHDGTKAGFCRWKLLSKISSLVECSCDCFWWSREYAAFFMIPLQGGNQMRL